MKSRSQPRARNSISLSTCMALLPILSEKQMLEWNGEAYNALVLASHHEIYYETGERRLPQTPRANHRGGLAKIHATAEEAGERGADQVDCTMDEKDQGPPSRSRPGASPGETLLRADDPAEAADIRLALTTLASMALASAGRRVSEVLPGAVEGRGLASAPRRAASSARQEKGPRRRRRRRLGPSPGSDARRCWSTCARRGGCPCRTRTGSRPGRSSGPCASTGRRLTPPTARWSPWTPHPATRAPSPRCSRSTTSTCWSTTSTGRASCPPACRLRPGRAPSSAGRAWTLRERAAARCASTARAGSGTCLATTCRGGSTASSPDGLA
jgi:hypothetical protein